MLGIYVSIPVACFRKGMAREYLETDPIPPPSTCYGFLLSLVGETDRSRHELARVTCGLIGTPDKSVVLRTVWRVKSKPLGSSGNTRPDYQQLLTNVQLVIWLDSRHEREQSITLESRVSDAMTPERRSKIERFGGLALGESTHLVDEVLDVESYSAREPKQSVTLFVLRNRGRMSLPVWVDHVGSAGTRYATGDLDLRLLQEAPGVDEIPLISSD
jgi:CRISPR-associated protein Cas5t